MNQATFNLIWNTIDTVRAQAFAETIDSYSILLLRNVLSLLNVKSSSSKAIVNSVRSIYNLCANLSGKSPKFIESLQELALDLDYEEKNLGIRRKISTKNPFSDQKTFILEEETLPNTVNIELKNGFYHFPKL